MHHPHDSIAPGILLAMPQLLDPNFRRTVILMTSHGDDGAMGLIVNRAIPATIDEILLGLDIRWSGPDHGAWVGGPVSPESGWVLFDGGPSPVGESSEVLPGLWMTASVEALRHLAANPPRRFRLLLGYAGWGAGQVEKEIVEGSWMLVPACADLIFETPAERMWETAYRRIGVDPATIVPGGGMQ